MNRDEIIAKNPLLAYCEARGWKMRRSGAEYVCRCPFPDHEDHTPSFFVNPEKQLWLCRGCKRGGSIIDLHIGLNHMTDGEAIKDLGGGDRDHKKFEELATYTYTDENGIGLFQVVRCKGKIFPQFKLNDFGDRVWKKGSMDGVRRVVYRLPSVIAAKEVFIVEGEKDVHTVEKIGRVATCNPGGAGNWGKWNPDSFNEPFFGKRVIIIPDADASGRKHADDVGRHLVDVAARVEIVHLTNGSKDISDFAAEHGARFAEAFTELVKTAREFIPTNEDEGPPPEEREEPNDQGGRRKQQSCVDWPEPKPLEEYLRPVDPPPLDKMPEIVSEWIADIARHKRCAPDFPAAAALVMFGSVSGTRFRICVNHNNHEWEEATNIWGLIIGPPGSRKTPAMDAAFSQLTRLAIEESTAFQKIAEKFAIKQDDRNEDGKALKKEIGRLRNECLKPDNKKKEAAEAHLEKLKAKLEELISDKPEPPVERLFFINDATTAALGDAVSKDPNCLLFFRDEMTGLLQQLEMKSFEDLRQFFLESWDGKRPYKGRRMSRGEFFIACLCLALFGGIQPAIFIQYLCDPSTDLSADGMLQRFQASVYPDMPPFRRHVDEPSNVEAKNRCFHILRRLAFADVCNVFGAHPPNEHNKTPWIRFDVEAKKLFGDWLAKNELKVRDTKEPTMIREHLSKYPKLFCAIAAIFHVIELANANNDEDLSDQKTNGIPRHCVEWAIAWCSYFESHIRRIHDMVSNPSLASAIVLAGKLVDPELAPLEDGFRARDVLRRSWKGVDDPELITSALARLEEVHWLRRIEVKQVKGGPATDEYSINPAIKERRQEKRKS